MKPEYDFLKSTTKKGGILLTAEWLEKNLGIKKGETIISASIGGKVLLTRFNPDIAFDAKALELLANGNKPTSNEKEENTPSDHPNCTNTGNEIGTQEQV